MNNYMNNLDKKANDWKEGENDECRSEQRFYITL